MVPPNGLVEGTPRFGEQQKRLSPGRKVSPTPGLRKSGSQPPTPEKTVGSPTKIGSTWGFQLSSLASAGMSRRGGASSFVAPVRESWGAGLRNSGSVGTAGLTASSSQKSLSGEGAAASPKNNPSAAGEKGIAGMTAAGIDGRDGPLPAARLRADQAASQQPDNVRLQREQVQDFLAALKQPASPSKSLSQSTLAPASTQGISSDASPTRSASGVPPPITRSRASTPNNTRSNADTPASAESPVRAPGKSFQEAVARQLEAHAERLVVLQRMLEGSQDRLQQLSEHVQRTGAEQRQRLEDLQTSQQQQQPASDQLSKLVGHMQWAENRIHLLISRVAAGEEAVEQLRHHTVGPGRASWDTWEVAQARKDLDSLRDQVTQLKAAGSVTQQALSEAVEPLRRDLRQLTSGERTAGSPAVPGSGALIENLMQEVMQVRELAARVERSAHRETMAVRQEVQDTFQSIRKEIGELPIGSGIAGMALSRSEESLRREFQTSTESLRQELRQLALEAFPVQETQKLGLQAKPREVTADGLPDLAGMSATDSLQELAGIGAQFRELGKQATPASRGMVLPAPVPSRGTASMESQHAAIAALKQAMEELRTWVLQLAPHCEQAAATRSALEQLQQDLAPLLVTAAGDGGSKEGAAAGDADGEIVGLMSRTSLLRALAVHGAALAMEASERSTLANRRCDELQKGPGCQQQSVASSMQDLVTRKEFSDAIQDIKWDIIHIEEQAEQGAHAADKIHGLHGQVQDLHRASMDREQPDPARLLLETGLSGQLEQHVAPLFEKLWQERSADFRQEICMLMSRTSLLRALAQHSIAYQSPRAGDGRLGKQYTEDMKGLVARVMALEEDVLKLIARQSVSRALTLHGLAVRPDASQRSYEELSTAVQSMQGNFMQLKEMAANGERASLTVAEIESNLEGLRSWTAAMVDVVERQSGPMKALSRDVSWLMARACVSRAVTIHAAKDSGSAALRPTSCMW